MGPKVDQSCCGLSLKSGAIFIALYHMIISTSMLITTSVMLYRVYNMGPKIHHFGNITVDSGREMPHDDKKRKRELLEEGKKALYIFIIVVFSFNFTVNFLLIIGAKKEKPLLLNIWIVVNSVFLMTAIVVLVINLFMLFVDPFTALKSMALSVYSIATTSYFLVVVTSLYHKLDHRQVAPRNDRPPPIVFIIDPTPPPENDLPPPYPSVSFHETPVEPYTPKCSRPGSSKY